MSSRSYKVTGYLEVDASLTEQEVLDGAKKMFHSLLAVEVEPVQKRAEDTHTHTERDAGMFERFRNEE